MNRLAPLAALTLLLPGCLFGGPPKPSLEMQSPSSSSSVDVQLLDSAVSPDEIYLKLVVHNANNRALLVDRRAILIGDGRNEYRSEPTTKPFLTIKPNASSSKLKLSFPAVPTGTPAYDLVFKKGAFRLDNEAGQEVTMPTVRLVVKKALAATPEPTPKDAPTNEISR